MELDIEAERRMQPGHEGLDAMCLREGADAWEQSFEPVLVFSDRAGPLAGHKLPERVGADWQPNLRFKSSEKRRHEGVPSSCWTWMNDIWVPASRL